MKKLIISLLVTSSVDSLNPIGITQQFILQGLVKKPRHIWFFILTTGVVNMVFGYLVYYGLMGSINNGLNFVFEKYGFIIYLLQFIVGLLCLFLGARKLIKISSNKNTLSVQTSENKFKNKSMTPLMLVGIGIISTVSELTSAVPYYAFLAVLLTYKLPFLVLTLLLIFYNIIYMAPFMVLYFIYIISKKKFDDIYVFFKRHLNKLLLFLVPLLLLVIAFVIIFDSIVKIKSII